MKKVAQDILRRGFYRQSTPTMLNCKMIQQSARISSYSFYNKSSLRFYATKPGQSLPNTEAASSVLNNEEKLNFVEEINDYEEWVPKVMQQEKPVILDCYADWCQPCKKLTPILEQVTNENGGKFSLVKLNIDKYPKIANGLKVSSIPAVFLVYQGEIADAFVGIPQPEKLQQFFNAAILIDSIKTDPVIMETLLERSQEYIEKNQLDNAEKMLMEGYSYENWRERFGPSLLSGIAYVLIIKNQDFGKAIDTLKLITEDQRKTLPEYYKGLVEKSEQLIKDFQTSQLPTDEELLMIDKVLKDPSDLQTKFDLAKLQFGKSKYAEAIEQCLDILKKNKNWNEKAAYTLLIEIFSKAGNTNEVVVSARKKLSKILF